MNCAYSDIVIGKIPIKFCDIKPGQMYVNSPGGGRVYLKTDQKRAEFLSWGEVKSVTDVDPLDGAFVSELNNGDFYLVLSIKLTQDDGVHLTFKDLKPTDKFKITHGGVKVYMRIAHNDKGFNAIKVSDGVLYYIDEDTLVSRVLK